MYPKININDNIWSFDISELTVQDPEEVIKAKQGAINWDSFTYRVNGLIKMRMNHCINELKSHLTDELFVNSSRSMVYNKRFHFSIITYETMLEYINLPFKEQVTLIKSNNIKAAPIYLQALKQSITNSNEEDFEFNEMLLEMNLNSRLESNF